MTMTGLNGGYYSGGLQQAHSTTPHEAPHSAGAPSSVPPPSGGGPPPTVSAISAVQPQGIPHGLVSKSVSSEHTQKSQFYCHNFHNHNVNLFSFFLFSFILLTNHLRLAA